MDKKLYGAALEGNVATLKHLIKEDPLLLDRVFDHDTPLHIAILRGHLEFARQVLSLNPRLATEVDSLGHSPLHLASAKGHVLIVNELVRLVPSVCLARSKDGKLPLHLAIMKGVRVEVVKALTLACPESTRERVDRGDTALHLCVKYNNLEVLQVLVDNMMGENDASNLLNAKNDDGNTILHLAALHKNLEIVKYLLAKPGIEQNAVNNNGRTAVDLIENSPKDTKGLEVLNFLLHSNAKTTTENPLSSPLKTPHASLTNNPTSSTKSWKRFFAFSDNNQLERSRGALFITAAIIAVVNALPIINMNTNGPEITFIDGYSAFSLSFVPAVTIMVLLVSGISLRNKLCVWLMLQLMYTALGFFGLNFIGTMLSDKKRYFDGVTFVLMLIWFGLLIMVSVLNFIRLVVWLVECVRGCAKKRKLNAKKGNHNMWSA